MSTLRVVLFSLFTLLCVRAHARTSQVDYDAYDDVVYTLDTGGVSLSEDDGARTGDCERSCQGEYGSCRQDALQNTEDYCGHAYEDFISGQSDRRTYEAIMETCYGMYEIDLEVCSTTLSMCQEGCDAG